MGSPFNNIQTILLFASLPMNLEKGTSSVFSYFLIENFLNYTVFIRGHLPAQCMYLQCLYCRLVLKLK